MKKKLRVLSLFLALVTLSGAAISCGSDTEPKETTNGDVTSESAPDEYSFESFPDYEFRVLNIQDVYSMHAVIDPGETNGDTLNDTQYNTVRTLEDKTGIKWKETNVDIEKEFPATVSQMVLSGSDDYDLIYQNTRSYYTHMSQGFYYNLLDYSQVKLDSDWFVSSYNNFNTVAGKLGTALGYSNLTIVDATNCMIFNQTMAETLGLDLPYDLVREGKWTLDKLKEYCAKAANLNGDENFNWKTDGKAVYGISLRQNTGTRWVINCGEMIVENNNGKLELTAGSQRFYDVCDKVASFLGTKDEGIAYYGNFDDNGDGSYINCFERQRALFGDSEVAKANRMRQLDFNFGVLPLPKYDESQERYYTTLSYPASGISIPVTCKTPERSAAIGDAVNYLFYENVWDVFRGVTLESKNLRNDDSIEMLGYILNSAYPEVYSEFSVGTDFFTEMSTKLRNGDTSIASTFATYEKQMKENIEKVNNGG